jgi:hypothetical protein
MAITRVGGASAHRLRSVAAAAVIAVGVAVPATAHAADAPGATAVPSTTYALPPPTGHRPIGVVDLHLVQTGRPDPWKPDRTRELMVSVWYPAWVALDRPTAPWLAPGLAPVVARQAEQGFGLPADSVDLSGIRSHAEVGIPVEPTFHGWPVVLFSPGLGVPRAMGTILVEELASRGYVAVSIDHTYETTVEFPGGRVEPTVLGDQTPETMHTAIEARVADTLFVLDQLRALDRRHNPDAEQRPLPWFLRGALDLNRIGMFGHSYGGFTAAETMAGDGRIRAGIDLDGTLGESGRVPGTPYVPGEAARHGLDRPFLLMGAELPEPGAGPLLAHTHLGDDRSWQDFWANQRGWKRDVLLHGSSHQSYTDLQALLPQLAQNTGVPAQVVQAVIGTIDPERSLTAQRAYVAGFFDLHLRHRATTLFDPPSPFAPEAELIP